MQLSWWESAILLNTLRALPPQARPAVMTPLHLVHNYISCSSPCLQLHLAPHLSREGADSPTVTFCLSLIGNGKLPPWCQHTTRPVHASMGEGLRGGLHDMKTVP